MTDYRSAYDQPVQPADPDPWHDRQRSWLPPVWFSVALCFAAVAWAVWS